MSICRKPGVICCFFNDEDLEDGTLARITSPRPGVVAAPNASPEEDDVTEDEKKEFELVRKFVNAIDAKGKAYKNARAYIDHRNTYFGSEAEYVIFAAASDKELSETEWKTRKRTIKLRQLLEINKHPDAQDIFYRWVRKAYFKKLGGDIDVPELVRAGMAPKLVQAIGKVRTSYKKDFKAGGFNPRPQKLNGKYRLGTLSEHGLGLASDINDATNAQINRGDWLFIEQLTGKKVDRSVTRWKKEPKNLWSDISAINTAFVNKVAEEVKRIEAERAKAPKPATSAKAPEPKPPLDVVLAGHASLKQWQGGFFTLDWELVEELHNLEFTWGATFPDVDLHHFELS
ncbi:MAG TPA: hypothetical protein VK633_14365 [Verrucomicrobiae bacterium]|nr:hypothetical protein [Verrucomicrobiae bacterium]